MVLSHWRNKKNHKVIGLDITSDFIKLLEVNSPDQPNRIESFAIESIPSGIIVKNEIKEPNALSDLLKNMFKDAGAHTDNVALAIPRSSVIIKNITIDSRLTPDEIESRAWIEANRHFPELVGNIYLDFSIIGPSPQNPSQLELMLIACRKEQIDPYLELLKLASLNPKIMDVNSYAFERALHILTHQLPQTETCALLNLDLQISTLLVMNNNQLIYAHDQTFDGRRLITQIQAAEKNKPKQEVITEVITDATVITDDTIIPADTIISDNAIVQDPPIPFFDVLRENLSSHLRHTMHFFYSSKPNISIQKIIISGDCANTTNLALFIQKEIGVEAVIANPFNSMEFNPQVDKEKLLQNAPSLLLTYGLALSKT